jgi:hypothetical protein
VAYKLLKRKELIKTLRRRGLAWGGGSPLFILRPKWLPYLQDPSWLAVERWIELVNRLPDEEKLAQPWSDEVKEQVEGLAGSANFEVPGYRIVDFVDYLRLLREARKTLLGIATQPRPAEIDHFAPDPFVLLSTALALVDLRQVQRCPICEKVFFAKRIDQMACTGPCTNTARQRRFRANRKRYERNRKRNREAKLSSVKLKVLRRLDALKTRPC